jgi:hypothetical protein
MATCSPYAGCRIDDGKRRMFSISLNGFGGAFDRTAALANA